MKRILSGMIVGIMVLSAFAFLATPAMGDVEDDAGGVVWTAYFNDDNMLRDPTVTEEDHPLVINEQTEGGGGGLFYLGDQAAIYSFEFETDEDIPDTGDPIVFTIVDSDPLLTPGRMQVAGQSGGFSDTVSLDELDADTYTFNGEVDIGTTATVEEDYGMTLRVTWAAGANTVDLPFSIYVSSIGHDTDEPDTTFAPELARADGNLFMPFDSFEAAEFELTPQGGYNIFADVEVDLDMPVGFTEFGNGEFMDPNDWNNDVTQTLSFRVDVDPGVAAGVHDGTFTWEYLRDVGGAVVEITEQNIDFTITVNFNPYVSASLTAPAEITQGDDVVDFEITFENEGNVDLYGVRVTVDTSDGDLSEYAFQYEQGVGGGDMTEPPHEYWVDDGGRFDTGDTDIDVDLSVFVEPDIAVGTHYVPLTIEGYYYNDGSLGDATGIVEFKIEFVPEAGNLVPERDPFVDLRAELTVGGTVIGFYDFGAWIDFEVDFADDPAFTVTADFEAIYIGGESQTENITLIFEVECDVAEWDLSVSSIILMGGPATPFTEDVTGVMPKQAQDDLWDDGSEFMVRFTVDLRDDIYAADWNVPVEITATYETTGIEYVDIVWPVVTIEDLNIGVIPGIGPNLYVEEQTIDIQREYDIQNNLLTTLEDVYATIHIGDNTPFLVPGHHPDVQEITMYVGSIDDGDLETVIFDMDLNEATPPGVHDVRLTVWGTVEDTKQMVLLSDVRTTVSERLFPEPSDLFLSEMRMGDIVPGEQFNVDFVIENIGGQRAHNIQVDFFPSEEFDDDFDVLNQFLESINVAYVDTTNDGNNRIRTDQWQVDQMSNISFDNYPGEWFLTLNESLGLFGMDDARDIYDFEDWIHRSRSSPRPAIYSFRIDTLEADSSVTISMTFNADREMVPGRVYAQEWNDNIEVDITWFDEENNFNEWSTDVSMMIQHSAGLPTDADDDESTIGDLGTGLLALVVVLLVIIIVLMLLAWSELRKPYEDDEFDMDHMEEEEIMSSTEPEPEPLDEFVEAPEPEVLDEPPMEDEDKF